MPYANIDGVNLYYEEYGAGPTVMLTPGGRVDHNGLRPMAALLSTHCHVIIHDRRNCGKSDVLIGGKAFRAAPVGRGDGSSAGIPGRCPGLPCRRVGRLAHFTDGGGAASGGGQGRIRLGSLRRAEEC